MQYQYEFNVSFAENQMTAEFNLVAFFRAANLSALVDAFTRANAPSVEVGGGSAWACNETSHPSNQTNSSTQGNLTLQLVNASAVNYTCSNSTSLSPEESRVAPRNFTAEAVRTAALFPWLRTGSDTLGPPLLSLSPLIVFLSLRITASFGDVAIPALPFYVSPATRGPAIWTPTPPPEINIYVEEGTSDADPASAPAMLPLLLSPVLSPLGGLPVSSPHRPDELIREDRIVAIAQVSLLRLTKGHLDENSINCNLSGHRRRGTA